MKNTIKLRLIYSSSFLGDCFLARGLYYNLSSNKLFKEIFPKLTINQQLQNEIAELLTLNMIFVFFIFVLIHLIFYLSSYFSKKVFFKNYIKYYIFISGIFMSIFLMLNILSLTQNNFYLFWGPIFIFNFFQLKKLVQ